MKTLSNLRGKRAAFTLIELLVAMSITLLLMAMLVQLVSTARSAWRQGEGQAESFTSARTGVDLVSRELQGAVVNLDLGFRIDSVPSKSHNYVIKFLTRRAPILATTAAGSATPVPADPNAVTSVMKVCYQLGWASRPVDPSKIDTTQKADYKSLYPTIVADYAIDHPIPVLVRTTSTYFEDVFNVTGGSADAGAWATTFADIKGGLNTGLLDVAQPAGITEVVAENVLGWELHPIYWDSTKTPSMTVADPTTNPNGYYGKYLYSTKAPRAIEIKVAVVPSQPSLLLSQLPEWQNVFNQSDPDLFALLDPNNQLSGTFNKSLRRDIKYFDSIVYLQSKTP